MNKRNISLRKCKACGVEKPSGEYYQSLRKNGTREIRIRCKLCCRIEAARPKRLLPCVVCGIDFLGRANRKFCSVKCGKRSSYLKHRRIILRRGREYYRKNRTRVLIYERTYRLRNLEKIRLRDAEYRNRPENRIRHRIYLAKDRAANPEKYREKNRQFRLRNKERLRASRKPLTEQQKNRVRERRRERQRTDAAFRYRHRLIPREKRNARARRYYQKNKEKFRLWRLNNRERLNAKAREHHIKHLDDIRFQSRVFRRSSPAYAWHKRRYTWIIGQIIRLARDSGIYQALASEKTWGKHESRQKFNYVHNQIRRMAHDDGTWDYLAKQWDAENGERPLRQDHARSANGAGNASQL